MSSRAAVLVLALMIGVSTWAATSQTQYLTCPVSKLEIIEGELPPPQYGNLGNRSTGVPIWPDREVFPPAFAVQMDGRATAELVIETGSGRVSWDHVILVMRSTNNEGSSGRFVFHHDGKKSEVRFRFPANANTIRAAEWFNFGQAARIDRVYRNLLRDSGAPGQAWFRHRISEVETLRTKELDEFWRRVGEPHFTKKLYANEPLEPNRNWVSKITLDDWGTAPQRRPASRGDHTELLSGGRAVAENLQLDRQVRVTGDGKNTPRLKIDTLNGITVRAYDWAPHTRGMKPTFDPLAALIPADQHAVFFPNATAAVSVLDEIDRTGLGVFNLAAIRSVDDRITDRYMKQLAIPAAQLGKLLPTSLVSGVAVTGSDLYYDTGTDVALLLATNRPNVVKQLLLAGWQAVRAANPDAVESDEKVGDSSCRALRTPDRRICAYACELPGALLLTNSPAQVLRLAARPAGTPALDSLGEYAFFRDRYRRGEADETAFALLSDDAIRRWCGPRWRIAHQRRIRSGSLLADAQAKYLTDMVAAKKSRSIDELGLGPIDIGPNAVRSAVHGTRLFQTPIAEVDIDEVTAPEAEAYNRWRESYQEYWSQFFDPIAVRLTVKPDRMAVDLSVMPLIARSNYREWVELSAGSKLAPNAGDPHAETIAHFVLGLNRGNADFAKRMHDVDAFLGEKGSIDAWIGDWFTIYADDDPLLAEFSKSTEREWEFWERNRWQIPVAAAVSIRDPAKFADFQVQARAYIKKNAADSIALEPKKFRVVE